MLHRIHSLFLLITVNLTRLVDHTYRMLSGKPVLRRSMITPQVYIGGQYKLNALVLFHQLGITGIVNMRKKADYTEEEHAPIRILHLPTADRTAPSVDHLMKGIKFITREIDKGGKVYIHCRWGEGRGPSMGIAYLLSTGMTLTDALTLVRKYRPFISLSRVQVERLQQLEEKLLSDTDSKQRN